MLRPGTAAISASVELPRNPFGRFLNVTALLHETAALPRFQLMHHDGQHLPMFLHPAPEESAAIHTL